MLIMGGFEVRYIVCIGCRPHLTPGVERVRDRAQALRGHQLQPELHE
jgi:hypothetical protein